MYLVVREFKYIAMTHFVVPFRTIWKLLATQYDDLVHTTVNSARPVN